MELKFIYQICTYQSGECEQSPRYPLKALLPSYQPLVARPMIQPPEVFVGVSLITGTAYLRVKRISADEYIKSIGSAIAGLASRYSGALLDNSNWLGLSASLKCLPWDCKTSYLLKSLISDVVSRAVK